MKCFECRESVEGLTEESHAQLPATPAPLPWIHDASFRSGRQISEFGSFFHCIECITTSLKNLLHSAGSGSGHENDAYRAKVSSHRQPITGKQFPASLPAPSSTSRTTSSASRTTSSTFRTTCSALHFTSSASRTTSSDSGTTSVDSRRFLSLRSPDH